MAKKKTTESPAAPSLTTPALYANHTHVGWADGVIRLTMSEMLGDQTAIRAALLISPAQPRELSGLLQQAVHALSGEA